MPTPLQSTFSSGFFPFGSRHGPKLQILRFDCIMNYMNCINGTIGRKARFALSAAAGTARASRRMKDGPEG